MASSTKMMRKSFHLLFKDCLVEMQHCKCTCCWWWSLQIGSWNEYGIARKKESESDAKIKAKLKLWMENQNKTQSSCAISHYFAVVYVWTIYGIVELCKILVICLYFSIKVSLSIICIYVKEENMCRQSLYSFLVLLLLCKFSNVLT